eukprot:jgi/Botrbrau1/19680/Bobra.0003s0042.1
MARRQLNERTTTFVPGQGSPINQNKREAGFQGRARNWRTVSILVLLCICPAKSLRVAGRLEALIKISQTVEGKQFCSTRQAAAEEGGEPAGHKWCSWAEPRVPSWGSKARLPASRAKGEFINRSGRRREKVDLKSVKDWLSRHKQHRAEVAEMERMGGGWDVLLLGSSFLECLRGTRFGKDNKICVNSQQAWKEVFGGFSTHVLAMAGDKVANVMWRVLNGGLPQTKHPRAVVVYAGADDLEPPFGCQDEAIQSTANRITLLLEYLHNQMPSTTIVYMAILPHGHVWPNMCTGAIEEVNGRVHDYVDEVVQQQPGMKGRLLFADFSYVFLEQISPVAGREAGRKLGQHMLVGLTENSLEERPRLKHEMMADAVHPNPMGFEALALEVESLLSSSIGLPAHTAPRLKPPPLLSATPARLSY